MQMCVCVLRVIGHDSVVGRRVEFPQARSAGAAFGERHFGECAYSEDAGGAQGTYKREL